MRPVFVLLVLAALASAPDDAVAQCLESERQVGAGETAGKVKHLLCKAPGGQVPTVSVEFQRLSATAASVILEGRTSTYLTAAFGKPAVIKNEVFTTYREILSKVGAEESTARCVDDCTVSLNASGDPEAEGVYAQFRDDKITGNRFVTIDSGTSEYPSAALNETIKAGTAWPQDWQITYQVSEADDGFLPKRYLFFPPSGSSGKPFSVSLWRYADASFFTNYASELKRFNDAIRVKHKGDEADSFLIKKADPRIAGYTTLGTLPADFFLVTAHPGYDACAQVESPFCCWSFDYQRRTAELDVAVITNVTKSVLNVDSVLGDATSERTFRAVANTDIQVGTGSAAIASIAALNLKPGEKALLPLRVLFPPPMVPFVSETDDGGSPAYEMIMTAPAGALFSLGQSGSTVKKVRESFRRPVLPTPKTYAFGPEVTVSALVVGGQRIELKPSPANFIELTASSEAGSCPYLTAWNPETGRWTEFGKVLDNAKGEHLSQSETIRIDGFRSRFRIVEREAEVAHIDSARLIVMTKDHRSLALEPDLPLLARSDGRYATVLWGETIEFSFALPRGVSKSNVGSSQLVLTGYYERYGELATRSDGSVPKN